MKLLSGDRKLVPGQGALGVTELCAYLGCSRTTLTVLRKEAQPPFPEPMTLLQGSRKQWITRQVDAWMVARQELLMDRRTA